MEFNQKLQALRRQKGLTQEELAAALFVSRAAVSKWESGRGYPNIDSLRAIAQYFAVSVDELLGGAQEEPAVQDAGPAASARYVLWGIVDLSAALLLVLPLFGQRADGVVQAAPLLALTGVPGYMLAAFHAVVAGLAACGALLLVQQGRRESSGLRWRGWLSAGLTAAGVLLFIVSRQPYAAAFLFLHMLIKAFPPLKAAMKRSVSPM